MSQLGEDDVLAFRLPQRALYAPHCESTIHATLHPRKRRGSRRGCKHCGHSPGLGTFSIRRAIFAP
jgi:hypothetical protein